MNPLGAYLGGGFFFSEAGLALLRRSASGSTRRDAGSLRILWIVNTVSITVGFCLAVRGVGPRLPEAFLSGWLGVATFALGTALRWWSIYYLGRFFTVDVALAADHRVVDRGPFRLIRHPSYSGLLLQFLGLGLTLGTIPSVAVVFIPPWLTLTYRMRVEERALIEGLGEAYVEYRRRTKSLIPWLY